jgi:hypothetical protein
LDDFWEYLSVLASYSKWLLTGGPFLAENIVKRVKPSWTRWLDQKISAGIRVRIEIGILFIAAFVAAFLAWRDEHIARRSIVMTPVQQTTIDRLSGDLTAARGKIDAQEQLIDAQQSRILSQAEAIERLKPKPARHLTEDEKQNLERAFSTITGDYPTLTVSAPSDGEAQGYARELMIFFNSMGMHVDRVGFVIATNPDAAPLQIVIKNSNKVPPKAERFAKAMVEAKFQIVGGVFDAVGDDEFALIVGPQR